MSLRVSRLAKSYYGRSVFDELSFTIESGTIMGLLGLNGAGKTTLLKSLATLTPFDAGDVSCDGVSLQKTLPEYQKRIGFQPEHSCLNPVLSVTQQLRLFGTLRGMKGEKLERRIAELLDQLTLNYLREAPCGELSKGETQRVSFAIANIHSPKLLLLDEPTSGLDPKQLALFRGVLQTERKNRTVLLSTHHLHEVESLCDSVLVLHNGAVELMPDVASGNSSHRLERYFIHSVESGVSAGVVND